MMKVLILSAAIGCCAATGGHARTHHMRRMVRDRLAAGIAGQPKTVGFPGSDFGTFAVGNDGDITGEGLKAVIQAMAGKWQTSTDTALSITAVPGTDPNTGFVTMLGAGLNQNLSNLGEPITIEWTFTPLGDSISGPVDAPGGEAANKGFDHGFNGAGRTAFEQVEFGLSYLMVVKDSTTQDVIHVEPGLIMFNVVPGTVGESEIWQVERMGSIPHCTQMNAFGTAKFVDASTFSPSVTFDAQVTETSQFTKNDATTNAINGLFDCYKEEDSGTCRFPENRLVNDNDGLTFNKVVELELSTGGPAGGGIQTCQWVHQTATVTDFAGKFYLERGTDADGKPFKQIQFSQFMNFGFQLRTNCAQGGGNRGAGDEVNTGATFAVDSSFVKTVADIEPADTDECGTRPFVQWPHIAVGTLRKVD